MAPKYEESSPDKKKPASALRASVVFSRSWSGPELGAVPVDAATSVLYLKWRPVDREFRIV
ncbi:MAG: hypothetical protein ACLQIS_07405 [Bryobacteraceae bacterium]